jgi:aryl-alcohol dehydrogenase-like predicted oxidoreductase
MLGPLVKDVVKSAVRASFAGRHKPKMPSSPMSALPPIVLGTGHFYRLYRRWRLPRAAAAEALLDAAHEAGCNAFDTARVYGEGLSENILGKWIRARRVRDRVVVIGKGGHPDGSGASRVRPEALTEDLHRTLRCLGVEYVDLYMLHRDDPDIGVGPIMETLHSFAQAGKVAALGASNWSHTRIEEANIYAAERGLTPFVASSPHLSLAEMVAAPWPGCLSITGDKGAEARIWYGAAQMPVLAWSPLGGGYLLQQDASADRPSGGPYDSPANAKRRERLRELAARRGVSAEQLALAYLLHQEMNVIPVVAASTPDRIRELLAAPNVTLSMEERDWLDLRADSCSSV